MPGAGRRRVSNSGGCTNANSRLSGRKRVQTGKTCETVVASRPRGGGGKGKGSLRNKIQRNDNTDDEEGDDEDEEELVLTQVPNTDKGTLGINNNRANTMNGMSVSTEPQVGDEVSMLRDSHSSVQASWESKMEAMMEIRMKEMEANWKSQRTEITSVVSVPSNDDFLRENLRKFVAERVFPKFKFIFKAKTLGQVVEMALTNGFITQPEDWTLSEMQKYYCPVVRHCLDGCRANAQSVARKKYIGK
jgi:hypothetical protein